MAIVISEEDITYAENILLPEGSSFNEERRKFIRCLESRDVEACPGSGKTTALLAKLLILAKKMPFEDGRGICVLTHTNVGIDEIKHRAGSASDSLFRYPNFFGTIQSFVNKFLAIPRFRSEFGRAIDAIDNDRFFSELEKIYRYEFKLKPWLEPQGGLSTLGSYWLHPSSLCVGKNLDTPTIGTLRPETQTYKRICEIRKSLLDRGILSYNDAYSISLRYIDDTPTLPEIFSNRFCMLFLDEAQDTYDHQFRVLNSIFPPDRVIVQRIGDPNQAIFSTNTGTDLSWIPVKPLHFSDTQRYGETITKILSSVRLREELSLVACRNTNSFPPQIITFNSGEEQKVLQGFSRMMERFGINDGHISAIGWIGKDKSTEGKLCIPAYFPKFDRQTKSSTKKFSNLISYSAFAIQTSQNNSLRQFSEIIHQGIASVLNIEGLKSDESGRTYYPKAVEDFWKKKNDSDYYEFRSKLAKGYLLASNSQITPLELRDIVVPIITEIWTIKKSESQTFLANNLINQTITPDPKISPNHYISENGAVIRVGTVHSVKGETHMATLYLDTYYQKKTDSQRLIEFLKGNRPKKELGQTLHIRNLLMAHVGFSRPKRLLAFACQASNISGHEKDLMKNGWEIQSVSDLLN